MGGGTGSTAAGSGSAGGSSEAGSPAASVAVRISAAVLGSASSASASSPSLVVLLVFLLVLVGLVLIERVEARQARPTRRARADRPARPATFPSGRPAGRRVALRIQTIRFRYRAFLRPSTAKTAAPSRQGRPAVAAAGMAAVPKAGLRAGGADHAGGAPAGAAAAPGAAAPTGPAPTGSSGARDACRCRRDTVAWCRRPRRAEVAGHIERNGRFGGELVCRGIVGLHHSGHRRPHRRQPLGPNLVVHERLDLLIDKLACRRTIAGTGGDCLRRGPPIRPCAPALRRHRSQPLSGRRCATTDLATTPAIRPPRARQPPRQPTPHRAGAGNPATPAHPRPCHATDIDASWAS